MDVNMNEASEYQFSDIEKHILARLDALIPAIEDIHVTLERKVQFNFTLMSSIATVLAAVNVSLFDRNLLSNAMLCWFILFGFSYLLVAILSLFVLLPRIRDFMTLTPSKQDLLGWWHMDDVNEYLQETFGVYAHIWQQEEKSLDNKAFATKLSYVFVVIGVISAIVEAAIYILAHVTQ